jgi:hypothetical protein
MMVRNNCEMTTRGGCVPKAAPVEQLMAIAPDMLPAGFYFRAFNGKRNFAPPAAESDWFKLESLMLANGDDVGVVTMWASIRRLGTSSRRRLWR